MKRNALKITLIVFLLCLPGMLITLYYASSKIFRNPYLDEYNHNYIFRFDYERTVHGWFETSRHFYSRIWFLPSQKEKMLAQIMEDIKISMPEIKEWNEERIVDYEFREDSPQITVYLKSPEYPLPKTLPDEVYLTPPAYYPSLVYLSEELEKRLALYCEILYGAGTTYYGNVIEYRYTDTKTE